MPNVGLRTTDAFLHAESAMIPLLVRYRLQTKFPATR